MSSIQGVIFAAVSGAAVILLALKVHKSLPAPLLPPPSPETQFQTENTPPPRPCISSAGERKEEKKKKKKVRFAKDVVEPLGNNDEFRRRIKTTVNSADAVTAARGGMPANRVALYNGILRDRVVHRRLGYSY